MPYLRYEGLRNHVADVFGRQLHPGDQAEFTDQEARSLLAQPHLRMVEIPTPVVISPDRPSANASRRQWAAYAETRGVTVADGMTREQIVSALDTPEPEQHVDASDGEPEAAGEGHPTDPSPKE